MVRIAFPDPWTKPRFGELLREEEHKRLFREIARQQKDGRAFGRIFFLRTVLSSLIAPKPTAKAEGPAA